MGFISAPGPLELMVILVVALIVLGPARLPEAARSVGRGMRELKESLTADTTTTKSRTPTTSPARSRSYQKEPVSRTPSSSSCSIVLL